MEELVLTERPHEHFAILRLNRPKVLNALSNELMEQLAQALETLDGNGVTRAVVLTGDDRAFAAGADIGEFATDGPRLEVWDRVWAVGLPVIAAVRGVALGGGLELAMSCDLMVVADDARLGQPEINLGVMPGAGRHAAAHPRGRQDAGRRDDPARPRAQRARSGAARPRQPLRSGRARHARRDRDGEGASRRKRRSPCAPRSARSAAPSRTRSTPR